MRKKRDALPEVTIACTCGAQVRIDRQSNDGVYICSACKAALRLTPPPPGSPSNGGASSASGLRPSPGAALEIVCKCGEHLRVRPEHVGRRVQCSRCGVQMKLERVRDPQTLDLMIRASEVPPEREPESPPKGGEGAKGGSAALSKIPKGARSLACRCGARLLVLPEHLGKEAQCPQCGLLMRLYSYHDPQTGAVTVTASPVDERGRAPAAEASIASQELLCQCGEHLLVKPEHVDKQVQCAACGVIMVVEKTVDPATSVPTLRARVVGKVNLDAWSLDDFK